MESAKSNSNPDSYDNCYKDGLAKMPCGCKSNLAVKDDTCSRFMYWNGDSHTCDRCFHDKKCHSKNR